MKDIINFLIEIGKFKKLKRKGWVLRKVKDPESVAAHTFRLALAAWILGKEKGGLDEEKLIKMALIHDLCELYAGSITPYDHFWPEDKKKQKELLKTLPRFSKEGEKKLIFEKRRKEQKALINFISKLVPERRKEILHLWLDFDKRLSKEGRFLKQLHKIENLLQALEYWEEDKEGFPIGPWWIEAEERVEDPFLIEFLDQIRKKYHQEE